MFARLRIINQIFEESSKFYVIILFEIIKQVTCISLSNNLTYINDFYSFFQINQHITVDVCL